MMYICNTHATCLNAPECDYGQPHEQTDNDLQASRCYDIAPYVTGGVVVWSEPIQEKDDV